MAVALTVAVLISWAAAPLGWAGSEVEQAILAEIQDFSVARQAGDVDRMLSYIADDAKMVSSTGRELTKAEYGAAVKGRLEAPSTSAVNIRYRAIKIDLPDPTHAMVLLEQSASFVGSFTQQGWQDRHRLEWKFEKRGQKWLIVEQVWLK